MNISTIKDLNGLIELDVTVEDVKHLKTKTTNQTFAIVTIKDDTDNMETVVYPRYFAYTQPCWIVGKRLNITGEITFVSGEGLLLSIISAKEI